MENPRNLNEARALIAELSAQVTEIASLREQASQVEVLRTELAESEEAFNSIIEENSHKIATLEASAQGIRGEFDAAVEKIKELEASAKSAEIRALEIVGSAGGKPLAVSENADEGLTLSDFVTRINAEKDPLKKGQLFKEYQKKQKGK
jgi:hypothetical protein